MTELPDQKLPDLKLLDDSVLPPALQGKVSIRTLRAKARRQGQCYQIARRTYVTPEQLAALLESFRLVPREPFVPRQLRGVRTAEEIMDSIRRRPKKTKPEGRA